MRYNARLRDMNLAVTAQDDRAIEVLASGLPLFFGAQVAVDKTLRCALTAGDCTAGGSKDRRRRVFTSAGGEREEVR